MTSQEGLFNFQLEKTTEELQKLALDAFFSTLPSEVQKRVRALKTIQDEHDELYKEYQKERLELENKWAAKYAPLYDKRKDIVNGQTKVEESDISAKHRPKVEEVEEKKEESDANKEQTKKEGEEEGIPNFWLVAMKNNFEISVLMSGDRDEEALSYLTDIRSVNSPDNLLSFTLEFYFRSNPFFENEKLTKSFHLSEEGIDDISVDHCEGCTINWKPNNDLSVKKVKRKQRKKKGGQTRVIEVTEPASTFFNFFKSLKIPEEELEEEVLEELEEQLLTEYEIGTSFQKKLISQAVLWFTGEAIPEDEGFDDDDPFGFEDEDDEDEEEEEEEEEVYYAPRGRGGRGGRGGGRGGRGGAGSPPQGKVSISSSPPSRGGSSGRAAPSGGRGGASGRGGSGGRGRGSAAPSSGTGTTLGGPPPGAENPECKQQ